MLSVALVEEDEEHDSSSEDEKGGTISKTVIIILIMWSITCTLYMTCVCVYELVPVHCT